MNTFIDWRRWLWGLSVREQYAAILTVVFIRNYPNGKVVIWNWKIWRHCLQPRSRSHSFSLSEICSFSPPLPDLPMQIWKDWLLMILYNLRMVRGGFISNVRNRDIVFCTAVGYSVEDNWKVSGTASWWQGFNLYKREYFIMLTRKLGEVYGFELTFHKARHNFGTHITLSMGIPIETVGKWWAICELKLRSFMLKSPTRK